MLGKIVYVAGVTTVIGVLIGGLIGEATALSAGPYHHALAIGLLVGAATGLGFGVMIGALWSLEV